jgi:AhpD family alkylhydroperoxidase
MSEIVQSGLSFFCTSKIENILAMHEKVKEFRDYRARMNDKILASDNKVMKRIYNIDTNTYMEGALSSRTKEMLGLVSSMVLRCDDCVRYHLEKCHEQGVTTEELFEIFSVANLVGGTIVIPHTRRALEYWEALNE